MSLGYASATDPLALGKHTNLTRSTRALGVNCKGFEAGTQLVIRPRGWAVSRISQAVVEKQSVQRACRKTHRQHDTAAAHGSSHQFRTWSILDAAQPSAGRSLLVLGLSSPELREQSSRCCGPW
jgi:hypothetical protein